MSLVNDMLKELEQRDSAADSQQLDANYLPSCDTYHIEEDSSRKSKLVWLAAFFILIIIALSASWQWLEIPLLNASAAIEPLPRSNSSTRETVVFAKEPAEETIGGEFLVEEPVADAKTSVTKEVVSTDTKVEVDKSRGVDNPFSSKELETQTSTPIQTQTQIELVSAPLPTQLSIKPSLKSLDKKYGRQVDVLISAGSYQQAQDLLQDVLSSYPSLPYCQEQLFDVLLLQKKRDQAFIQLGHLKHLEQYQRAFLSAKLEVAFEQWQKAAEVLEQFNPRIDSAVHYYALLAAVYHHLDRHRDSINQYQQLLMVNNQQSTYWLGLAISADALGESSKALEAFRFARQYSGLDTNTFAYVEKRISELSNASRAG